ncbi:ATP-binding protein [Shewanella putrefaciens]|uniref:ATP-binding protein n=1 Tax=Shewanella putrefaciens TaxID=24 RepID=UPI003D78BD4A
MMDMSQEVDKLLKRLGCPEHIKPDSPEVYRHKFRELQHRDEVIKSNEHRSRLNNALFGKSGLNAHFLSCSFENYQVERADQRKALDVAKRFVDKFIELSAVGKGFLFIGTPGTGKNHLAAAIANALMARHHSVVLLSVMDLFSRVRESYNDRSLSEERLIAEFMRPELLIIDEIGLQRGSVDEMLWLTRIIDKRLYGHKSTGFITNLDTAELQKVLGERAYERLLDAATVAVTFNWPSYRGKRG